MQRPAAQSDSEVVTLRKLGRSCWLLLGLARSSALGLASCGSRPRERQGRRHAERHLRLLPRLPRPGALLHGRRLDGDVRHLHPAAHLRARRRRRRAAKVDPRPGREHCRRSATAARPTRCPCARASSTPTARRSRPPTSPTRSNALFKLNSRRLALLHRASSAPKSSPKPRAAASPGSRPTTRPARSSST